jgi:hypothetical protein
VIYRRWHWSTKVGTPRRAFPAFMAFPQSLVFRNWGLVMVWDAHTITHTQLLVDERERAMGFYIGTTATPSQYEGQRHFVLSEVMDLRTMDC